MKDTLLIIDAILLGVGASALQHHLRRKRERRLRDEQDQDEAIRRLP